MPGCLWTREGGAIWRVGWAVASPVNAPAGSGAGRGERRRSQGMRWRGRGARNCGMSRTPGHFEVMLAAARGALPASRGTQAGAVRRLICSHSGVPSPPPHTIGNGRLWCEKQRSCPEHAHSRSSTSTLPSTLAMPGVCALPAGPVGAAAPGGGPRQRGERRAVLGQRPPGGESAPLVCRAPACRAVLPVVATSVNARLAVSQPPSCAGLLVGSPCRTLPPPRPVTARLAAPR